MWQIVSAAALIGLAATTAEAQTVRAPSLPPDVRSLLLAGRLGAGGGAYEILTAASETFPKELLPEGAVVLAAAVAPGASSVVAELPGSPILETTSFNWRVADARTLSDEAQSITRLSALSKGGDPITGVLTLARLSAGAVDAMFRVVRQQPAPGLAIPPRQGNSQAEPPRQATQAAPPIQTPPARSVGPARATLTVRLPAGKETYRLGEEIPVELEFQGTGNPGDTFWTSNYDRSGRIHEETYAVTPNDGVSDPLGVLYLDGIAGGGLGNMRPLDGTPWRLTIALNEYVTFSRPGRYELVVTSRRLRGISGVGVLTSAPVSLTIVAADDSWTRAQMAQALQLIATGGRETVDRGARLLSWLGTEAAARETVAQYNAIAPVSAFQAIASLARSPHRQLIVREMERMLDAATPLHPNFIRDLTQVRGWLDRPGLPTIFEVINERRLRVAGWYDGRAAVPRAGLAADAATIARDMVRLADPDGAASDADAYRAFAAKPDAARRAFTAMPGTTKWSLLKHHWPAFNHEWIESVLREVYQGWRGNYRSEGAGDFALRRLHDRRPVEARPLIIEEIGTGARGLTADALSILLERTLPELDEPLRRRLATVPAERVQQASHRGSSLQLIARYGSPALTDLVAAALDTEPCRAEPFVFLSKHDPAEFDRRLSRCTAVPFSAIAAWHWDDRIEAAARTRLAHENRNQAMWAARALGMRGAASAKTALIDALSRWNAEWRDRVATFNDGTDVGVPHPVVVQDFLVNALLANDSFALTAADVARMRGLCLTDGCRATVDARAGRRR